MWLEDPFFDLKKIQRNMERVFKDFSKFDIDIPDIDISEKENEIVIKMDMPGIEKEDIDLFANENLIEVKAERRNFKEEKGENFFRRERGFRSYHRQIPLPVKINPEKIEAEYNNGVLTLIAEKKEKTETKKKKIKIK